jgi:hypothetical protein
VLDAQTGDVAPELQWSLQQSVPAKAGLQAPASMQVAAGLPQAPPPVGHTE